MARFIPVDGPIGPEESLAALMFALVDGNTPRPVSFEYLSDGQVLLSRLDVTEINKTASELSSEKRTIYGNAILYREEERLGG